MNTRQPHGPMPFFWNSTSVVIQLGESAIKLAAVNTYSHDLAVSAWVRVDAEQVYESGRLAPRYLATIVSELYGDELAREYHTSEHDAKLWCEATMRVLLGVK